MAADTLPSKQHAHELLDRLGPGQLNAIVSLLKVMIDEADNGELTSGDRQAVSSSREYFRQNPQGGIPFEQLVAECGLTMDQIRG